MWKVRLKFLSTDDDNNNIRDMKIVLLTFMRSEQIFTVKCVYTDFLRQCSVWAYLNLLACDQGYAFGSLYLPEPSRLWPGVRFWISVLTWTFSLVTRGTLLDLWTYLNLLACDQGYAFGSLYLPEPSRLWPGVRFWISVLTWTFSLVTRGTLLDLCTYLNLLACDQGYAFGSLYLPEPSRLWLGVRFWISVLTWTFSLVTRGTLLDLCTYLNLLACD